MTLTAAQNDLALGRLDIGYFARRWLGVRGNPGQLRWWAACAARGENGYGPQYLTTVVSAGNRAGKTLAMAVVVLHHAFYKLGLKVPTDEDSAMEWLKAPYQWYHVGIYQETAELLHRDCVMILRGEHLAQEGRKCPLTKELGPIVSWAKNGDYQCLTFSPVAGGAQIHFRSTQDKAKALLGKDMNGISFDEAGFEMYLTKMYQEVFNFRRMSTGGPLHFIGTPDTGLAEYYDLWELGNPENPNRNPQFISFRLSTRDNIGYGLTQEQFDDIVRQTDPYLVPQNIDGMFIEAPESYFGAPSVEAAFIGAKPCADHAPVLVAECEQCDKGLPEEQLPIFGHRYVQGVDPGIAADSSWAIVIDYTGKEFIGVRVRSSAGRQTIVGVVNMVREGSSLFGELSGAYCATMLDSTSMGGKMWKQEFSIIPHLREFDFAGEKSKKLKLLSDLKSALDKKIVRLPREGRFWQDLRRQLLSYKLDDRKITQDAVMALAIAVYHAVRDSGEVTVDTHFTAFGGYNGSIGDRDETEVVLRR